MESIKRATCYKTADGEIHKTEAAAIDHEVRKFISRNALQQAHGIYKIMESATLRDSLREVLDLIDYAEELEELTEDERERTADCSPFEAVET